VLIFLAWLDDGPIEAPAIEAVEGFFLIELMLLWGFCLEYMLCLLTMVRGEFYAVFAEVVKDPFIPTPLVCTMTPFGPSL